MPVDSTLLSLLKALIRDCLPGIIDGELASILSQRSLKSVVPELADLPAEVVHATIEEVLEGAEAQAFKDPWFVMVLRLLHCLLGWLAFKTCS